MVEQVFTDHAAGIYDAAHPWLWQKASLDRVSRDLRELLTFLGQDTPLEEVSVLNLPARTGYAVEQVLQVCSPKRVVAVDPSDQMLLKMLFRDIVRRNPAVAVHDQDVLNFVKNQGDTGRKYNLVIISPYFFTESGENVTMFLRQLNRALPPRCAIYVMLERLLSPAMPRRVLWPYALLYGLDVGLGPLAVRQYIRMVEEISWPVLPELVEIPLIRLGFQTEKSQFSIAASERISRLHNRLGARNSFSLLAWRE